jgi:hydrogenase nickel incorporation protein HypA/HybF
VGAGAKDGATVHELAITQSIVDAVSDAATGAAVARVHLRIGKLSGVVPDAVRFCFELVADGTCVAGAALVIEEPPGAGHCRSCDARFELPDQILLCPCGSADVEIVSGRELVVRSFEVA